jgi:hypothetical protein
MQDARCRMQDAGCKMQNPKKKFRIAEYETGNPPAGWEPEFRIQGKRNQNRVFLNYWLLATDY